MQTLGHQQSVSNYVYNPDPTPHPIFKFKVESMAKGSLKIHIYILKGWFKVLNDVKAIFSSAIALKQYLVLS